MRAPSTASRGTLAIAMSRTAIAQLVLASSALVLAYLTWTAGERPDRPQEQVTVLECAPADLRSITLRNEQRTIRVAWQRDGDGRTAWITITPARPTHGPTPEPIRFATSEALDRWVEQNMPLRAARSLGEVDHARLAELGLADATTTLDIDCGARHATYRLGGSTYGTEERYARASTGGPVFLFGPSFVAELERAEANFMQRELHRFALAEIDEVRVETARRARSLLHRNRRTPNQATWVDATEPALRNELYGNWLDRVAALRTTEFLATGREPGSELAGGGAQVTQVVSLRYAADGRERGALTLVRAETAGTRVYYAQSEVTHGWVRVLDSVAAQIEQDARPVVGLDAVVPSPAAP